MGEQEQPSHSKFQKVAVRQSRLKNSLWILINSFPIGLSFGILQLSIRHLFYGLPPDINQVLPVLQIVAEVHDVLIDVSLSWLVLYYLQQHLISARGLPYGLFTSGKSD